MAPSVCLSVPVFTLYLKNRPFDFSNFLHEPIYPKVRKSHQGIFLGKFSFCAQPPKRAQKGLK